MLESLVLGGRDLLHTVLMMQPQAHQNDPDLSDEVRAFYEYHACLQEPWDGPAALSFTDGRIIGASLDRNGLRPSRYQLSDDGLLVVGSEVGVIDLNGAKVIEKGRLGPGQIIALDTETGEIMRNDDIKARYAAAQPYQQWLNDYLIKADTLEMSSIAPAKCLHRRRIARAIESVRLHDRGHGRVRQADDSIGFGANRFDGRRHAAFRFVR